MTQISLGFLYNQLEGKKLQDVANATREAAINAIKACKEATDIHNSCANTYTNAIGKISDTSLE